MKTSRGNNMFRKKGLIYAGIILAIIIIFDVFFLNSLVKAALIWQGKSLFMAKVSIASVKIDLLKSKTTIKGLVVADRNKEFKNLFETSEITADFMFLPLLEKKFIIDNVSVINLAVGTDRKDSGFLAPADAKKIEKEKKDAKNSFAAKLLDKAADKASKEIQKMPVAKLSDLKDVKNLDYKKYINKETLESYKAADYAAKNVTAAKTAAEASIKAVDADAKLKAVQESIKKVKETKIAGVQDLAKGQQALAELDNIKKTADELTNSVNKAKDDVKAVADVTKASYDAINEGKENDIKKVMSAVNINILDAKSVEKALIGPVWYDKVTRILQYIDMANKYIPVMKKKDKKATVVKRGVGREVIFSYDARYPGFWIKKMVLSVDGKNNTAGYFMRGEIDDIAIEQGITGKPLKVSLQLDNPSQTISVKASIYHVEERDDSIVVEVANLPASAAGLNKVDFGGITIPKAKTAYMIKVRSTDAALTVNGEIREKDVEFASADKNNLTYQVLSNIDAFQIDIMMRGAEKDSSISVTSDIGERLKKAVDKIYGKKVAEAKAAVNKAIEQAIKDKMKEVTKLADGAKAEADKQIKGITDKISANNKDIDKAKSDITKKIAGGGTNNLLKGLFK